VATGYALDHVTTGYALDHVATGYALYHVATGFTRLLVALLVSLAALILAKVLGVAFSFIEK